MPCAFALKKKRSDVCTRVKWWTLYPFKYFTDFFIFFLICFFFICHYFSLTWMFTHGVYPLMLQREKICNSITVKRNIIHNLCRLYCKKRNTFRFFLTKYGGQSETLKATVSVTVQMLHFSRLRWFVVLNTVLYCNTNYVKYLVMWCFIYIFQP